MGRYKFVIMKTYSEVESEIYRALEEKPESALVSLHQFSEYGEWNHQKMTEVTSILHECTYEDVEKMIKINDHTTKELWDLIKKGYRIQYVDEGREELHKKLLRIRNIGQEIHDRGGFQAMHGNFQIFVACLNTHPLHSIRIACDYGLNQFWDGVGDWNSEKIKIKIV